MSDWDDSLAFGSASVAWRDALAPVLSAESVVALRAFLAGESSHHPIVPDREHVFAAFDAVEPDDVRVVILGQDPYPTPGHAHGLAFSYRGPGKLPRSLANIRTEIERDLDVVLAPGAGDFTPWAEQGVLLLNTALTTRAGRAGAHRRKGWESITRAALEVVCQREHALVFMLWGGDARKYRRAIDPHLKPQHLVLEAGHPSPLSIKYFRGCSHFSRANAHLAPRPVDWARIAPSQP